MKKSFGLYVRFPIGMLLLAGFRTRGFLIRFPYYLDPNSGISIPNIKGRTWGVLTGS